MAAAVAVLAEAASEAAGEAAEALADAGKADKKDARFSELEKFRKTYD